MTKKTDVMIVSGVRTPIGSYGGSLKDIAPTELAAHVVREAVNRAAVDPSSVGHVVFGNVIHTEPKDMYLSRVAALKGGLNQETVALTLNRLCGSGLQALISAAQSILLGDTNVAVAGGAESMSRASYVLPNLRWGQRMGHGAGAVDMMVGALTDPLHEVHMGITAENVAKKYEVSRSAQDASAAESHRRAINAQKNGYFKEQILPIDVKGKKGTVQFAVDEHPRADVTTESLNQLRPAFLKDGTVTAGNASGINDGAGALVLMETSEAIRQGARPMARLVAYGHSGVDPQLMGIGPVEAVRSALKRAGLKISDMDVIESNEAFAAQACAVSSLLEFDPKLVNPNGGAIALGHPIGATGAILSIKAIHELQRTGKRYALVTMCIGGGQGIAAIFERA